MMLPFQWNALRVGDHVVVHDDSDPGFALAEGVVAIVQSRARADNDVAVRLDTTPPRVVRPRRHAVHMAPLDKHFECARCQSATERAAA